MIRYCLICFQPYLVFLSVYSNLYTQGSNLLGLRWTKRSIGDQTWVGKFTCVHIKCPTHCTISLVPDTAQIFNILNNLSVVLKLSKIDKNVFQFINQHFLPLISLGNSTDWKTDNNWDWRNNTVNKVLALYAVNPGFIPGIPHGFPSCPHCPPPTNHQKWLLSAERGENYEHQ